MKDRLIGLIEQSPWFKPVFDYYKGLRVGKQAVFSRHRQNGPDGYPIPSSVLLVATTGSADPAVYLDGGKKAIDSITDVLADQNITDSSLERVLDFGCGCGRVLRHWSTHKELELHGVDIDERAVHWCTANLPFCSTEVCGLTPPLEYPKDYFSFIYVLSVLTHLDEDQQISWVREWHRVLRHDGILLFTLHGDYYRESLSESERKLYDEGRVVIRHPRSAGTNRCGTYHPPKYVLQNLTEGFELIVHIPTGALGNPHQDLYLLRKRDG